jgi:mono/diheme cytochrome c family protein
MKRGAFAHALFAALAGVLSTTVVAADDQSAFSKGRGFDQRSGEAIYKSICQGCHMPDGKGATGAGTYPALADNVRLSGAAYPIVIVLAGRKDMPAFGRVLDNEQVAAVVGYIRTHFANAYTDAVIGEQVDALRIKTKGEGR